MPQLSFLRSLKVYFTSNLHGSEFTYVLWPFLRVFKVSGFAPIKLVALNDANNLRLQRCEKVEWDILACVLTGLGAIVYVVGFACGVNHLSHFHNWAKLYETSTVTFVTSWAQIFTLFIMGAMSVITTWTHMRLFRRLCGLIYKIDDSLRCVPDIVIDYKPLRTKLMLQFILSLLLPVLSSMVNCVVIETDTKPMFSSCFWFICFLPILLLTIKEFQFFSILFILKSKFELVNKKLKYFGCNAYRVKVTQNRIRRLTSTSELPLTVVSSTAAVEPDEHITDELNLELLQKLFELYSSIADAVDLTLRIFAWHLLLVTATSVFVITIQSYNLFMLIVHSMTMEPMQIFFIVMWIMVQIIAVGINVSACSMTAKTMAKTGPLLHKIRVTNSECGLVFYQVLQLFSLEVLQRKHNFTASGFFDVNYKLITSIFAAVTTYLVIIIQFHLTNIPGDHFHQPPV